MYEPLPLAGNPVGVNKYQTNVIFMQVTTQYTGYGITHSDFLRTTPVAAEQPMTPLFQANTAV